MSKELNFEKIKELREQGETYKTISELVGYSITTIRKYCINNNIEGNIKNKIIGKSFEKSNLLVIELDNNPLFQSHETAYKCKCLKCGNISTYRKSNIINGPGHHSCTNTLGGRGYKEWYIGQKFGYIEIIGQAERKNYVIGRCDCGKVREFSLVHLKGQGRHSRTISCGCKQISSGELKIENILKENSIEYQTQYKILDFSLYASFDFAIFNEQGSLVKLIEFDGLQHFEPVELFGGEEQFKIQQERDRRKNEYCKQHNISLLRIPYYDYSKIDINYLLSQSEI